MSARTARAGRALRGAFLALGMVLAFPVSGSAMPSGEAGKTVRKARNAVRELRVETAARLLEKLGDEHANDPDVRYVQALLRFHEAEYDAALEAIHASLDAAPARGKDDGRTRLQKLIEATAETTDSFVESRSSDGRFVVRHEPGRDEILVPYALEAMKGADEALAEDLGTRVPGPIILEVYPTAESLAEVSTLSADAIRRTGTIALCKWDRLMITSPRALVRGYPWMDTIAHEYVHLVLTRASHDHAPVWFQEGVAKFLEHRWRGWPPEAHIDPAADALLRKAAREDDLIPFRKLHPSIAKLPSQRDAALAFAQVATFFDGYHEAHGGAALREAIARVAQGTDARKALAEAAGSSWNNLEASWRARLRRRPAPQSDAPRLLQMRFSQKSDKTDEREEVEAEKARRYVRLGDLLWDRDHAAAAKVEYGKAHEIDRDDPVVSSRLARAALAAGDPARAIEAIEEVIARHPDHAPARSLMAAARLRRGQTENAREAAREAIWLNPFDPKPHCVLATAAADEETRDRERNACTRLGGSPRQP